MALRGDTIDNIPGAPGIGDKGSVELIQQYGTVEAALDDARDTPDIIKKQDATASRSQNNRETVLLSKDLVTIHCNLPRPLLARSHEHQRRARPRRAPRPLH